MENQGFQSIGGRNESLGITHLFLPVCGQRVVFMLSCSIHQVGLVDQNGSQNIMTADWIAIFHHEFDLCPCCKEVIEVGLYQEQRTMEEGPNGIPGFTYNICLMPDRFSIFDDHKRIASLSDIWTRGCDY